MCRPGTRRGAPHEQLGLPHESRTRAPLHLARPPVTRARHRRPSRHHRTSCPADPGRPDRRRLRHPHKDRPSKPLQGQPTRPPAPPGLPQSADRPTPRRPQHGQLAVDVVSEGVAEATAAGRHSLHTARPERRDTARRTHAGAASTVAGCQNRCAQSVPTDATPARKSTFWDKVQFSVITAENKHRFLQGV